MITFVFAAAVLVGALYVSVALDGATTDAPPAVRGGRLARYSVSPPLSGSSAGWLRNVLLLGCRAGRA
jgi:hypothetical protein